MKFLNNYTFRMTTILVAIFAIIGGISYQVVQDSLQKKMESDALLIAKLAVKQGEIFRRVYVRNVISKLKEDGFGADPHFIKKKGFVPISAQFVRMMSQEAKNTLSDYQYKPVGKWNLGPYSIDNDDFLRKAWAVLEEQEHARQDKRGELEPLWEVMEYMEQPYLRYVSAITVSSQKCIDCHLSYEKTEEIIERRKLQGIAPLTKMKVGELMGMMSVDIPMNKLTDFSKHETAEIINWLMVMFFATMLTMIAYTHYIIRQRQNLQDMTWKAGHDKLTNLLNRRGFERLLAHHMQEVNLGQATFSICFIDLDGFKAVNDTYGHEAGDHVLKEIADLLSASIRSTDICARLGGDEFIILYVQCTHETAFRLANELLDKIRQANLTWNGNKLEIGASMGVAEYNKNKHNKKSLLEQADSACYESKANGKNQVT